MTRDAQVTFDCADPAAFAASPRRTPADPARPQAGPLPTRRIRRGLRGRPGASAGAWGVDPARP